MKKERAGRNQTLTLDTTEAIFFEKQLLYPNNKDLSTTDIINKTICADLFDVIELMPAAFADLIIIDPPYNLTKNFNGYTFKASNNEEYIAYLESWFSKVVRCLKPNGSLYLCGDWKNTSALQQVLEQELTILNRITWQREKGRGAKANWKNSMEDIWFAVKDAKNYYFDVEKVMQKKRVLAPYKDNGKPKDWTEDKEGKYRMTYPSNFWNDISVPFWSMPENTDHPTQKPEKLIAKLILASCPADGVVFDPFLGSGTSSVVAKKLGRKYVGIEKNKEYCLWAEKRLDTASRCSEIQGYKDGIFLERNSERI